MLSRCTVSHRHLSRPPLSPRHLDLKGRDLTPVLGELRVGNDEIVLAKSSASSVFVWVDSAKRSVFQRLDLGGSQCCIHRNPTRWLD
ncbi:hypothetical protein B0T14DRAFT_54484 [Immersiella caudata]|uniref:Uncharacterized protein n=1 Tax=Immersiella caudata TaxID=314043 RepID=A0AA39XGE3_9PEZI|nr:hypothetical protein B0T14DRAFT_54484 [Immersiella caudata]